MKNIELASIDQIDLIMKIIKACTNHMIKNCIFQWNDKYPTKQSFIDDNVDNNVIHRDKNNHHKNDDSENNDDNGSSNDNQLINFDCLLLWDRFLE